MKLCPYILSISRSGDSLGCWLEIEFSGDISPDRCELFLPLNEISLNGIDILWYGVKYNILSLFNILSKQNLRRSLQLIVFGDFSKHNLSRCVQLMIFGGFSNTWTFGKYVQLFLLVVRILKPVRLDVSKVGTWYSAKFSK